MKHGKKTSAPIGITQVVGFCMQDSSEQIKKRGQLALGAASFSLEAVSDAARRYGIAASLVQDGPWGLGRRGQVLNWIGAKRYEHRTANDWPKDTLKRSRRSAGGL
ncbi:MAG TPA: hypothetical protein VGZ01_00070 [Trinickia sp.]|nr:hypothetical protein [Trinickia sp.]